MEESWEDAPCFKSWGKIVEEVQQLSIQRPLAEPAKTVSAETYVSEQAPIQSNVGRSSIIKQCNRELQPYRVNTWIPII